MFNKRVGFLKKKSCPRQRSCPGQVGSSKKQASEKKFCPGSAAAPDKFLGREKATNRCSQGRGAPFGGPDAGGCRGPQPPASRPPKFESKFIFELPIHRPGGRYVMEKATMPSLLFGFQRSLIFAFLSRSHFQGVPIFCYWLGRIFRRGLVILPSGEPV